MFYTISEFKAVPSGGGGGGDGRGGGVCRGVGVAVALMRFSDFFFFFFFSRGLNRIVFHSMYFDVTRSGNIVESRGCTTRL